MKYIGILFINIFILHTSFSQGPPITGDKAIMLGEQTFIVKTLSESLKTDQGTFNYFPFMVHYLPTSNSLVAVHIPYVSTPTESGMADIIVRGKYQIYRKDGKAKTHRMALKSVHWLPTGVKTILEEYGNGEYQTQLSLISGYETLKHGIGAEVGYRFVGGDNADFFKIDANFGLPVLKPTYPVNQLNFYFEYSSEWYTNGNKLIFFSQGIQYARDQVTLDFALQMPLLESGALPVDRQYKLLFGARYVW